MFTPTILGVLATLAMPPGGEVPAPQTFPDAALAAPCCPALAECCNPPCGPPGRFWGSADLLLFWVRGDQVPALVTTSPAGTPQAQAGVLGAPGTQVLAGDSVENGGGRLGGLFSAGYWLDCQQTWGVEANFFFLEGKGDNANFASNGNPILARPFADANSGQQVSELVAFPGLLTGSVAVTNGSSSLYGAGAFLRHNVCCGCCYRVDLFGGYQYLHLADHLGVTEDLTSVGNPGPGGVPPGTNIVLGDRIDTVNDFNGFNFGVDAEYRYERWVLGARVGAAVGATYGAADVAGSTTVTTPGMGSMTSPGGLLALGSNSGHFSRVDTVVIPQFWFTLGYQVTDHLRLRAGYAFLLWPQVIRPGEQIDTTINPNLLPPSTGMGPARPATIFGDRDVWIQGITLGAEFRF